MIGTLCDVGTFLEGTLNVRYTSNNNGTSAVTVFCNQNNPGYA